MDIPEITPASGPDSGRVHGFPIDPEDWGKGIDGAGETGSYEEIARPLREDAQAARELWARAKLALGDTQVGRWLGLGAPVQAGDAKANADTGDIDNHAGRLIRLLPAILRMRRERGESTAPLSNCVIRPEEIVAAEARLGAEAAGVTDVGRQRKQNEDCVLLRPDLALFCVADGMGGHNAGDVASERVTAALGNHFEATALGPVYDELPDEYAALSPGARRLAAGVAEANRDVHALSQTHPQHRGMGSTCVALHLAEGMAHVAHVGDSRCYRIRDGELVQMTRDHSLINDARNMKPDLTEEDLGQASEEHHHPRPRDEGGRQGRRPVRAHPPRRCLPALFRRPHGHAARRGDPQRHPLRGGRPGSVRAPHRSRQRARWYRQHLGAHRPHRS